MGRTFSLILITILSLNIFTHIDVFADDQVRVSGHRMLVDTAGVVHITGIVENTSNNSIGLVRVIALLFDENGNNLPTYDTYTLLRTIPAGYTAPFDIPISDKRVGSDISSYTLSLEWKVVQTKLDKFTFLDFNAFVWTHIDPNTKQLRNPHELNTGIEHNSHAHSEISALIKNIGNLATKTVNIIVIWYDERGQYYNYNIQTTVRQLVPLESSRFMVMTHPTMGYYTLMAESEDYVSMYTENGEHMLRLHEANSDNELLPGVDTMSMTDLVVKDTRNNIIDKIPIKNKSVLPHFESISTESTTVINDGVNEYQLQIRTYENQLIDFHYEQNIKTITILTSSGDIKSTNPALQIIHVEIIIPNTFNEFLSTESFEATINGVLLPDRLFFIDPYSYKGNTAIHYIISRDDLQILSEQMTEQHSDRLVFTVQSIENNKPVLVKVAEPIQLQSIIANNIDNKQKFVYIMKINDSTGVTVMLSWIDGNMSANKSINTVLSWTPEKEGKYTIQAFLWESLTYPSVMSSDFVNTTFVVS